MPVLTTGDGISAAVIGFRDILRRHGYQSEIYASLVHPRLRHAARRIEDLQSDMSSNEALIYHLSIGSTVAKTFAEIPARKVLFYQNVTPAETAADASPILAHHLRWGRADLAHVAPLAELGLAASGFSARELRSAGCQRVAVVPLPANLHRLRPRPAHPSTTPALMFVGRFAPHKRQDVLIKTLAVLRRAHGVDARLVLVGSDDVAPYIRALEELAVSLDVRHAMRLESQPLSDRQLGDLYAEASVFVCASDHEGFCLPLLEAMAFDIPVVAFRGGAVAETLGYGGVLLDDHDALVWAEVIATILHDDALRQRLTVAGRQRLSDFGTEAIGARLQSALDLIGIGSRR